MKRKPKTVPAEQPSAGLTVEAGDKILSLVSRGAYPQIAAVASSISRAVWKEWIAIARRDPASPTGKFMALVEQAAAECRAKCEAELAAADPKGWLTKGPGRERPGSPGWANVGVPDSVEEEAETSGEDRNAMFDLFEKIKDRLTDDELAEMMSLNRRRQTEADE